jgi:hypothetical protein
MNKHSVIVIISILVIVAVAGNSIWNIYAVEQLQLSVNDESFRFYQVMVDEDKFVVCNPFPFPVSFNQFYITVFFEGDVQGTFSIDRITIPPKSSQVLAGTFFTEDYSETQYLFMHFDHTFEGNPIRIDPAKMTVQTEFQTPILGIIPFSVTNQYSSMNFWNMLNDEESSKC